MTDVVQPTERKCELCSASFFKPPREAHDRFQTRRFCSRSCQYTARRKNAADPFSRPELHKNTEN